MKTMITRALLVWLLALHNTASAGGAGHNDENDAPPRGPNGGILLQEKDVTVELAIVEQGVPPEYRAWIHVAGKEPQKAQLTVTLTRLGGAQEVVQFARQNDYWRGDGIVGEPHSFDVRAELQFDGRAYHWEWPSYEGRMQMPAELAAQHGITTAIATSGRIEPDVLLHGKLIAPPEQIARIGARFPGVVTRVLVSPGDRVQKNDPLAEIESNDSLQRYTLHAPLAGVVLEQTASVGELTGTEPLFVLQDNRVLWAELAVFPQQRGLINAGQTVYLQGAEQPKAVIRQVLPASGSAPYARALVTLDNTTGARMAGDRISARVGISSAEVALRVDNRALQSFRDWTVVFIQVGDTYEIRPLTLGRRDSRFSEVLEGLQPGDRYVVENSYLIKADLEKSGAAHDH